jgi:hypothetical protein
MLIKDPYDPYHALVLFSSWGLLFFARSEYDPIICTCMETGYSHAIKTCNADDHYHEATLIFSEFGVASVEIDCPLQRIH